MKSVVIEDVHQAKARIRASLPVTPLTFSPLISELAKHEVYFKWENKHRTGSFKERGALNFILQLIESRKSTGVCAASAGNHALALSTHSARYKVPCLIVMPVNAPLVKVQSTRNTGAEVLLHGMTFQEAYEKAQDLAKERSLEFVSAYDNAAIVAGQGTCGLEIMEQLTDFDTVVVPVGGGGLISGIAVAIKSIKPDVQIIGVESEWSVNAKRNVTPGKTVRIPPVTIADGIAIKKIGAITGEIMARNVNHMTIVNESEIAKGIIQFLEYERTVVEGAGAAGLAALMNNKIPTKSKRTVVVVSGSNIDMNVLARLIEREMGERGRLLTINISVPDRPGSLHATTGIIAATGANVLNVNHDRSCSFNPGNVDITFQLEVRDEKHKKEIIAHLEGEGIHVVTHA